MNTVPHAIPYSGPFLNLHTLFERADLIVRNPAYELQYDRRACTVCGHPDSPSMIDVWYDTLRDRVCGDCFAWATAKMKTVKLQRMYR